MAMVNEISNFAVDKRSYLFLGKPGTKKTRTLRTFRPPTWKPGDPPWAYVFATDKKKEGGMLSLAGDDGIGMEYDVYRDATMRAVTSVLKASPIPPPTASERFVKKFNGWEIDLKNGKPFPYTMVALDSAGGLIEGLYEEILYRERIQNPQASAELKGRTRPSMSEIGDCQWYLLDWVSGLLQLPCIVVVTCHTRMKKDADNNTRIYPDIPGQSIFDNFLGMFDEVYYFEQKPGKDEIVVRTQGTLATPARTSQPVLAAEEVPDFRVWKAKMEHYYSKQLSARKELVDG